MKTLRLFLHGGFSALFAAGYHQNPSPRYRISFGKSGVFYYQYSF